MDLALDDVRVDDVAEIVDRDQLHDVRHDPVSGSISTSQI
jgi:hypothetical protein